MVYEYFAEKSEYCLLPTVEGLKVNYYGILYFSSTLGLTKLDFDFVIKRTS